MYILGLNAYHGDSSACLIEDGKLIAAVEEERFTRIKHWSGFPVNSIRYCLSEVGISMSDVDQVAVNLDPNAAILKKVIFTLKKRPDLQFLIERLQNRRKLTSLEEELNTVDNSEFGGKLVNVEHHLSHVASSFLVSPFDEAVVVSTDGFGDFSSAAWGYGKGSEIDIEGRVYFPHSLGIFYQAITQFIGFPNYGDEYKVMGLAPYGEPKYLDQMQQLVSLKEDGTFELDLKYFRHHTDNIGYEWQNCAPTVGTLYTQKFEELFGAARKKDEEVSQREKDIARSAQKFYEMAIFNLLNKLYDRYQNPNLAIAGGTAMNSVANGKITLETPFEKVYIQSAAGDGGGAIGAAFYDWYSKSKSKRAFAMDHAFWGPEYTDQHIDDILIQHQSSIDSAHCTVEKIAGTDQLCKKAARSIFEGKVLGWFQGRMEWGPRALGNRSILCDPRRTDMKDILNLKIKRRESFRPFAPSVLREYVDDWFEQDDEVPFMMKVFQIKEEKRKLLPAVCHVDGSGRLQTVYNKTNPLYHHLISEFYKLSDVPMVLNTSFNENEPVVCSPVEALDCFLRTQMDALVLGSYFIWR